jgi:hypothetical protein
MATTTDIGSTVESIDAATEALQQLRRWAEAHPDVQLSPYDAGLWCWHKADLHDAQAALMDGAPAGTVSAEQNSLGVTTSIERTFGPPRGNSGRTPLRIVAMPPAESPARPARVVLNPEPEAVPA